MVLIILGHIVKVSRVKCLVIRITAIKSARKVNRTLALFYWLALTTW